MTDKHPYPLDPNQLAKSIIDSVTGQQPSPVDNKDLLAIAPDHKDGLKKELAHAAAGKKTRPA
jgi:hypothetical protein